MVYAWVLKIFGKNWVIKASEKGMSSGGKSGMHW